MSDSLTVAFYSTFFLNIHLSGVLTVLFGCYIAGATYNCCCLDTPSVYIIQPCTHMHAFSCNLPSALLAKWPGSVTCYCSTMGTWYQNKSQHRKLTLEKEILLLLLLGLKPTTFQSWVWCSNHWAIPSIHFRPTCVFAFGSVPCTVAGLKYDKSKYFTYITQKHNNLNKFLLCQK